MCNPSSIASKSQALLLVADRMSGGKPRGTEAAREPAQALLSGCQKHDFSGRIRIRNAQKMKREYNPAR
jgi:hypothetical protein